MEFECISDYPDIPWYFYSDYPFDHLEYPGDYPYHPGKGMVKKKIDKLGLSWAKLSCQLGSGCTVINICCLILINMK